MTRKVINIRLCGELYQGISLITIILYGLQRTNTFAYSPNPVYPLGLSGYYTLAYTLYPLYNKTFKGLLFCLSLQTLISIGFKCLLYFGIYLQTLISIGFKCSSSKPLFYIGCRVIILWYTLQTLIG